MTTPPPATRAAGWQQAHDYAERLLASGFGTPTGAGSVALHPTSDVVAMAVEIRESMKGRTAGYVALVEDGAISILRKGYEPAWSPDGSQLAHLGEASVWVGEQQHAVPGTPERLQWNADGSALLVLIADSGSELSNLQGSGLIGAEGDDAWLPHVESTLHHHAWRRLLVLDPSTGAHRQVHRGDLNVWDATWAGEDILAVCSDGSPTESAWYAADLRVLNPVAGTDAVVVTTPVQFGAVAASPSGRRIAYVESWCSDRDILSGPLMLHNRDSGETRQIARPSDVGQAVFLDEERVAFCGLESMTTRIGVAHVDGSVETVWEALEQSASGPQPTASHQDGRIAFVRVGFRTPPELVLIDASGERVLASLSHDGAQALLDVPITTRLERWSAPDGLEIEGWLQLPPTGEARYPLVVMVHGGPIGSHRAGWMLPAFMRPYLIEQGYAVLLPNPRGSSGRGAEFTSAVVGDMGGADMLDITSGVEALIDAGVVDRERVGVMGGSYGGFMTAWMVTQTDLFAAGIAMYPITDWGIQHGVSSIPYWDELFLDGKPYASDGEYVKRAPMTHVANVRTPTLFIGGGKDRATPSGQALSMHRALASHGVQTECVIYPNEGHGATEMPAVVDTAARAVDWFGRWMPAR